MGFTQDEVTDAWGNPDDRKQGSKGKEIWVYGQGQRHLHARQGQRRRALTYQGVLEMFERRVFAMLAIGIVVARRPRRLREDEEHARHGRRRDRRLRNAQIDVSDTPCSDNAKFSTLVLQDGKYVLGNYQFEMFGDTKRGDVTGHTQTGSPESSVFVGNCAIDGQTSQVLFVYGNDANGRFARLGATNLTDNGNGLVQSFDIANSEILVEQNQGNPPKLTKTEYALLNGKLTNLSPNATAPSGTDADLDNVSFQVFHDKLQPYGRGSTTSAGAKPGAPTTRPASGPMRTAHWENSDEYGATWVSNDPWGDTPTPLRPLGLRSQLWRLAVGAGLCLGPGLGDVAHQRRICRLVPDPAGRMGR